jgi:erythromycin esterase
MTPGSWDRRAPFRGAGWYAMVGRAGFLVRLLAAAAVLVGCAAPPADASAAWVAANAIPLRGVDPLADGADLVPLAAAIGDAQVVGLGEAVHGVAEEITAKHRLLRLLVEQAGSRSVAWEDDWTVGLLVDDYVRGGPADLGAVLAKMSPQWQSRQVADVLRWLRAFNTGRPDPVRFVGVEYYLTRASAYDAVEAYVAAAAQAELAALRADLRPLRPGTDDMFAFVAQVMAAPDKQARLDRARRVQGLVERLPDGPDQALAAHHAAQIVAFWEHYSLPDADALVHRDAHAAANLRWWRDRSGDKVVYWAATPHTANAPTLRIGGPPGPDLRFPSVGSYLRAWYGERYRSVGVTPGHGSASLGEGQTAALADPAPDRFEKPLSDAGPDVFALDLRQPAPPAVRTWLAAPATFRGLADRGDAGFLDGGSPTQWFDLVVFHRTATPAGMP